MEKYKREFRNPIGELLKPMLVVWIWVMTVGMERFLDGRINRTWSLVKYRTRDREKNE